MNIAELSGKETTAEQENINLAIFFESKRQDYGSMLAFHSANTNRFFAIVFVELATLAIYIALVRDETSIYLLVVSAVLYGIPFITLIWLFMYQYRTQYIRGIMPSFRDYIGNLKTPTKDFLLASTVVLEESLESMSMSLDKEDKILKWIVLLALTFLALLAISALLSILF